MTNLDEHMEEHLAAREAEQKANDELNALHYRAAQDNQRFDRIKSDNVYLARIAANATSEIGMPVVHDKENGKLVIGGVDTSFALRIEEEWGGSSFRPRRTGRVRIVVGNFGSRKSYPERKNGLHNYEAILIELCSYARGSIATRETRDRVNLNQVSVFELESELGLSSYGRMTLRPSSSTDLEKPIVVKIDVSLAVTAERAREIHAALRAAGLI